MRRLLLVLLLLFVPTLAWAGEDQVHGAWHVAAFRQGKQEIPLPSMIVANATFDKAGHDFALAVKVDKEHHEIAGKWSANPSALTFTVERVDGHSVPTGTLPAVDFAYALEGARLVLSIRQISLVLERDGPPKTP